MDGMRSGDAVGQKQDGRGGRGRERESLSLCTRRKTDLEKNAKAPQLSSTMAPT